MSRPKKSDDNATFQSIRRAAEITGLSAGYIKNGCIAGTIPHIRVGVDYRVNMELFKAQLNSASISST